MKINIYKFQPSAQIESFTRADNRLIDWEGRVYTPFGLVTFFYVMRTDHKIEAAFEIWLPPHVYRIWTKEPLTKHAAKLFAHKFAKECDRLHREKGVLK